LKNLLKNIAKGSKLIIVYLITVIVAGSILTYLGINNISNYKELTEKRITEEEKQVIENYRLQFQYALENLVSDLNINNSIDSLFLDAGDLEKNNSIVNDYLILNKNGALIRPHFFESSFRSIDKRTTETFRKKYQLAEKSEFALRKYAEAEKQYLSALKYASDKSDSAKAYNAVARMCIKAGDQRRALKLCKRIINRFNDASNEFGFPYVYFSVDQLTKLTDVNLKGQVEELLIDFLSDLATNQIPYNNSTADIINGIRSETNKIENKEIQSQVQELLLTINRRIVAIHDYKNSIQAILSGEITKPTLQLNNFLAIINKNNKNEIVLLHQSNEYSAGYILTLKSIDSIVLANLNQTLSQFEYDIQMVDSDINGSFLDRELIIQNNFSPFFKNKAIQIKLKNPKIVEDYMFKRKITTAVGLILLLGAMLIGLFTLIQDEKRKKHMTRLRADFVSNVTHELKTPLTSINMFAESILLGRVESKKDLKKYSKVIVKESERLKRMINNILDFSRKENDKLTYHLKECDLFDLVNATMEEMNYWLEINKFEVSLNLQENIKAIVDPEGIKQVLSNLISNAIKYSDTNKKLTVRLYKKGKKVYLEIEDQGIGIPKEKHKNIFDKFYRVNSKKNENISGTGLGLTVSKDIIEAQNGKLFVESTFGKGSKFTIVLNL
jgi:signal transduction histidine kinase